MKEANQLENVSTSKARSPSEFLAYAILDRRNRVLDAIEQYEERKSATGSAPKFRVIAGVKTLYYDLRGSLPEDQRNRLVKNIFSNNADAAIKAFNEMTQWLYDKGLLKFDDIEVYDRTNIIEENKRRVG